MSNKKRTRLEAAEAAEAKQTETETAAKEQAAAIQSDADNSEIKRGSFPVMIDEKKQIVQKTSVETGTDRKKVTITIKLDTSKLDWKDRVCAAAEYFHIRWLRKQYLNKLTSSELKKLEGQTFDLAEYRPTNERKAADPKVQLTSAVAKLKDSGMTREEILALLEE